MEESDYLGNRPVVLWSSLAGVLGLAAGTICLFGQSAVASPYLFTAAGALLLFATLTGTAMLILRRLSQDSTPLRKRRLVGWEPNEQY